MFWAVHPLQLDQLVLEFLDPGIQQVLMFLDHGIQLVSLALCRLDVPVALRLTLQPLEIFPELLDLLSDLTPCLPNRKRLKKNLKRFG